jgi:shikimate kinase
MGSDRQVRNVALIGFMGVGKSSVGHLVAADLHFGFLDTDGWIEQRAGKPIRRIFSEEGEAVFRQWEREAVDMLSTCQGVVAATGGGLAVQPGNLDRLKVHALVVCLWASPDVIWERVRHQVHRPLLQTEDPYGRIRQLLLEREPFYRQADVLISTEQRSIKEVAHHVVAQYRLAQQEPSP